MWGDIRTPLERSLDHANAKVQELRAFPQSPEVRRALADAERRADSARRKLYQQRAGQA
jgi:hypothetical protein